MWFRFLAGVWVAATLLGCDSDPDSQIVGVWTLDAKHTVFPTFPLPKFNRRVRSGLQGTLLKLRTDHTYVLNFFDTPYEGTWRLKGDTVTLESKESEPVEIKLAGGHEVGFFERDTVYGDLTIVMKKTG